MRKNREKLDLAHGDIEFSNGGAHVKFLWDPWLNSSALHEELGLLAEDRNSRTERPARTPMRRSPPNASHQRTIAILAGGGHWHARHIGFKDGPASKFRKSIDDIVASIDAPAAVSSLELLNNFDEGTIGHRVFFAPVLRPLYDRLSQSRQVTIYPNDIDAMNVHLQELSLQRRANVLWSYANMTRDRPAAYGESGLHVLANVSSAMADVFINLRCNSKAALEGRYPLNRTCCMAYKGKSWSGTVVILCTFALSVFVVLRGTGWLEKFGLVQKKAGERRPQPIWAEEASDIPTAVLTLLLAACYGFFADRSYAFDKFPRRFSDADFRSLIADRKSVV